jgi:hypothetical protein
MSETDTSALLTEKIPNNDLYRIATQGSDEKAEVLIEVDLPPHQIEFSTSRSKGNSGSIDGYNPARPVRIIPQSPQQEEEDERIIHNLSRFLTKVLGSKPRYLRAGRAFVAEVTPGQLVSIAKYPLVKAVQPNRRLRMNP